MPTRNLEHVSLERCEQCGAQLAYLGIPSRVVGCSVCHHPVLAGHPLQVELDRHWRQKEERDADQARRAALHPAPRPLTYVEQLDRIQILERQMVAALARIDQLEAAARDDSTPAPKRRRK